MERSTLFAPLFRSLFSDAPRLEEAPSPSRALHDIEAELQVVA